MTFTGHVQDGKVVLTSPIPLPDGTKVRVEPILAEPPSADPAADAPTTLWEHYKDVIGKAEGLPADAATNVDHYLYGHPKR
jgi:hypothetical protein